MPQKEVPTGAAPDLEHLIAAAKAKVEAMGPAEVVDMMQAQRESWTRGELAMGESVRVFRPDAASVPDASAFEQLARLIETSVVHFEGLDQDESEPRANRDFFASMTRRFGETLAAPVPSQHVVPEPGEHQEVLDAIEACNWGEEE